jgi:hypothetical protein
VLIVFVLEARQLGRQLKHALCKKSKIYSLMNRHIYKAYVYRFTDKHKDHVALAGCQGGLIMFVGENVTCLCSSVPHHQ